MALQSMPDKLVLKLDDPIHWGKYRQPKICMQHHPEGGSYDNNSICSLGKTQPHQLYRLLMTLLHFICV